MKKFLSSLIFLFLAALTALSLRESLLIVDGSLTTRSFELSKWHQVINFNHNAYFSWKIPAILTQVVPTGFFELYQSITAIIIFSSLIFCLGLTVLLQEISEEKNLIYSFSIALLLTCNLPLIFGLNRVVILSFVFFPWLSWALLQYEKVGNIKLIILAFLMSCLLAQSANQYGLIILGFVLILVFTINNDTGIFKNTPLLLALFAPQILQLLLTPAPEFPLYPGYAKVVADDGIPGRIHPFFGAEPAIPLIAREALKSSYGNLSFYLLILSLLSSLILARKNTASKKLCWGASILLVLVFIDLIKKESFAQIMPIASLARMLPTHLFFPLAPLFLLAGILFLISALTKNSKSIIIILLFISLPSFANFHDYSETIQGKSKIYFSPSFGLIKQEGSFILNERAKIANAKLFGLPFRARSSNKLSNTTELITDNNVRTRWSNMTGRQDGKEWLELELDEVSKIDGLYLSVGVYKQDFPRALRISYSETCNQAKMKSIYQTADFQGAIYYTDEGYPYYGQQNDVKVYFKRSIKAKCLRIEQTASGIPFDWSVTKVMFISFR